MRTPLQAVLWELWRTSRIELLARVVGMCGLVVLFYSFTLTELSNAFAVHAIRGITLMLLTTTSLFATTWIGAVDSRHVGFSLRLGFTRPISTMQLVAVPMLFTAVAAVGCFLAPALLFGLLFETSMPLAGPMAVIFCVAMCLMAVTWSPTTATGKVLGLLATGVGLVGALVAFHAMSNDPDPILLAIGRPGYFNYAWYQYSMLATVTVLAVAMTVVAVDRQRHGAHLRRAGRKAWRGLGVSLPRRHQPFPSPLRAQCWCEIRRISGNMLLIGLLAPVLVLALVTIVQQIDRNWQGASAVWLVALACCPLVYQFIGIDGAIGLRRKQGAVQFPVFDATQALRNDQLVVIKLLVIAAWSALGWLCMGLAAGIHAAFSDDWHSWARIGAVFSETFGGISIWWWFACACNIALLYLSSSSILLAFGLWLPLHRRVFASLTAIAYVHIIIGICDFADRQWSLRPLWIAYGWVLSVAIVAGCLFVVRKALSSGFLGVRVFSSACCLWAVYVVSTVMLAEKAAAKFPIPTAAMAAGAAMLLVPLATTAIAPLALASHRHQ